MTEAVRLRLDTEGREDRSGSQNIKWAMTTIEGRGQTDRERTTHLDVRNDGATSPDQKGE